MKEEFEAEKNPERPTFKRKNISIARQIPLSNEECQSELNYDQATCPK